MRLLDRLRPRTLWSTLRWPFRLLGEIRARRRSRPNQLVVAVDARALGDPLAGVGWYLRCLLEALAETEGLRLRLYGPWLTEAQGLQTGSHGGTAADRTTPLPATSELPEGSAIERVRYLPSDELSVPTSWLALGLKLVSPWLVAAERPDLVFAPNFVPPRSLRRSRAPLCSVVHDMAWHDLPGTLLEETRQDLGRHLSSTLGRAECVITPSAAVKDRLTEAGVIEAERVHVVHHGPGHLGGQGDEGRSVRREDPVHLPKPDYALCVGTLEPRKNIATLLEAWQGLQSLSPADGAGLPRLVVCGAVGWRNEDLHPLMERGREEGWLELTGRISDASLDAYYRGATLAVCASLHEGFGLPLVEAMSYGVPLVVSDIPVFREVAMDAAVFVSPTDAPEWRKRVAELMADPSERARLAERGRCRAKDFSWARAAEQTLGIWRRMAESETARETDPGGLRGTR